MDINVEESILGLLVSNEKASYLSSWFPILKKPNGNFIEIKPGMNVIYGMNGSGKTQLLEAISSAAEFKLSTFEGFVLQDPKVDGEGQDSNRKLFDVSSNDVLSYFEKISEITYTADMMLGWNKGYQPEELNDENRDVVNKIVSEFLSNKKCLLTRALPDDKFMFDVWGRREEMNKARNIDFVPILLPKDEAPITRLHIKEIAKSFLSFQEELGAQLEEIQNLDAQDYDIVEEKRTELFSIWLSQWSWSPLMNLRNFGYLTNHNDHLFDGDNNLEYGFLNSDNLPVFLPAIYSYLQRNEYQEFSSEEYEENFVLSLKREDNQLDAISRDEFNVSEHEMGIDTYGPGKSLDRRHLMDEYLDKLRRKLTFLPGLRSLTFDFEWDCELLLQTAPKIFAYKGSQAEKRWLLLSKKAISRTTKWLVIDEPESGMHRTAEAELANVLASPVWNIENIMVVATHSPEFLNLPNANIIHIVKGETHHLTNLDRENFLSLGIRPSDFLAGIKCFLLVEGEHEKIIFEALFSEELEKMRCKIIVARGAKNMKDIFESQFIFDFTDAIIISLLDNIDSTVVNIIWKQARSLAQAGQIIEAGQYVRNSLPGSKSGENVFLSQFLTLALANGQHERVEVWGLDKPDIVLYFDPTNFGMKKSWQELLALHENSDQSFKTWAMKKFNADFSISAIEKAVANVDFIPEDFGNLLLKIATLSHQSNVN